MEIGPPELGTTLKHFFSASFANGERNNLALCKANLSNMAMAEHVTKYSPMMSPACPAHKTRGLRRREDRELLRPVFDRRPETVARAPRGRSQWEPIRSRKRLRDLGEYEKYHRAVLKSVTFYDRVTTSTAT